MSNLFDDPIHTVKEPIDYENELKELLCVLHRDGGHYIQEHGIKKAIEDSYVKYYERFEK